MKAPTSRSARSSPSAPAASAQDDHRLKLQALAAPPQTRRANWELRALGALGFELASART